MLLSQSEYEVLHPIYHGKTQKFDEMRYRDAIEYLIATRMIERIEVKNDAGGINTKYRITTLGRQAYEECENYLLDERRKDATLQTAKEAAQASEKSSKHSKICTIISVVIAGLMFVATVIQVVVGVLNYLKS